MGKISYHNKEQNNINHVHDTTVECRYNAVKYYKILHKYLQELGQNINQVLDPQKTPHISP